MVDELAGAVHGQSAMGSFHVLGPLFQIVQASPLFLYALQSLGKNLLPPRRLLSRAWKALATRL